MRLVVALMLCVVGLSASTLQTSTRAAPLPHDAYVWQRIWTPKVVAAAQRSAELVRSWRILLAEADRSGHWSKASIPWGELRAIGRPIIAVLRIDGRLDEERMPALLGQAAAIVAGADGPLSGVEIDYDCPTSKLSTYARFLSGLRMRLPASLELSITALPTWMNSADLERLVPPLDEVVLQVHAVDDPRRGLFNPTLAESRVRAFARRIGRPFRVALPAYDVRVTWSRDGGLASVEGEVPLLTGAAPGETLRAAPDAILAFLHAMQRAAPDNLIGIAWFRLPTDADRRAWSHETWRAVLTDRLPPARLSASLVPAEAADLWTVTLSNDGAIDATVPRRVQLDPACTLADGANGFRLVDGAPLALEGSGTGRLRPHRTRVIGWARCTEPRRHLDAAP
ncbi:DUF3142 domain-containing protein [Reyranella sp.]|uniref:DUF3142 domain-containing protein n=1 Tax=Reyranella sp. TaxID=1929291 RepID=UPI003D1493CC